MYILLFMLDSTLLFSSLPIGTSGGLERLVHLAIGVDHSTGAAEFVDDFSGAEIKLYFVVELVNILYQQLTCVDQLLSC